MIKTLCFFVKIFCNIVKQIVCKRDLKACNILSTAIVILQNYLFGIFKVFLIATHIKAKFGALGRSSLFALINLGTMGNGQRLQATIVFHRGIVHSAQGLRGRANSLYQRITQYRSPEVSWVPVPLKSKHRSGMK